MFSLFADQRYPSIQAIQRMEAAGDEHRSRYLSQTDVIYLECWLLAECVVWRKQEGNDNEDSKRHYDSLTFIIITPSVLNYKTF